jgi:hypothetical protein
VQISAIPRSIARTMAIPFQGVSDFTVIKYGPIAAEFFSIRCRFSQVCNRG